MCNKGCRTAAGTSFFSVQQDCVQDLNAPVSIWGFLLEYCFEYLGQDHTEAADKQLPSWNLSFDEMAAAMGLFQQARRGKQQWDDRAHMTPLKCPFIELRTSLEHNNPSQRHSASLDVPRVPGSDGIMKRLLGSIAATSYLYLPSCKLPSGRSWFLCWNPHVWPLCRRPIQALGRHLGVKLLSEVFAVNPQPAAVNILPLTI